MNRFVPPRPAILLSLALASSVLGACNPAEGVCRAEYDCQDAIGVPLEDDYVEVCTVTRGAQLEILRANAEKVCSDLANAELALLACLNSPLLTCEERADFANNSSSNVCEPARKARDEAFAAADEGLACDGVADAPAAPAAGEGEGAADADAADPSDTTDPTDTTDAGSEESATDAGPA